MAVPCNCCPVPLAGCYNAPATAQFARDLGPVDRFLAANVATFANFAGSGITVTISLSGGETLTASAAPLGLAVGVGPPAAVMVSIGFSAPVLLRSFDINDLDTPSRTEQLFSFSPPFSGVSGPMSIGPCSGSGAPGVQPAGCIGATSNNSTGRVVFPGPSISLLQFSIGRPAGLGEFLTRLAFDTVTPNLLPVFAFRCPDADPDDPSAVRWFNTTGDEIDAADVQGCPTA